MGQRDGIGLTRLSALNVILCLVAIAITIYAILPTKEPEPTTEAVSGPRESIEGETWTLDQLISHFDANTPGGIVQYKFLDGESSRDIWIASKLPADGKPLPGTATHISAFKTKFNAKIVSNESDYPHRATWGRFLIETTNPRYLSHFVATLK